MASFSRSKEGGTSIKHIVILKKVTSRTIRKKREAAARNLTSY